MDNKYAQNPNNIGALENSMTALKSMQKAIYATDEKIDNFINVLRGSLGMERRLNKAISLLVSKLEQYLQMTDTMYSSIDRIQSKGEVVLGKLKEERLIQ